jgi:hypothetical protein
MKNWIKLDGWHCMKRDLIHTYILFFQKKFNNGRVFSFFIIKQCDYGLWKWRNRIWYFFGADGSNSKVRESLFGVNFTPVAVHEIVDFKKSDWYDPEKVVFQKYQSKIRFYVWLYSSFL